MYCYILVIGQRSSYRHGFNNNADDGVLNDAVLDATQSKFIIVHIQFIYRIIIIIIIRPIIKQI